MFKGKTIVIVGASSGIGAMAAITLSKHNANVILIARREDKLRDILFQLKPGNHAYYSVDISEISKIETLVRSMVSEHGKLGGLVFTAGITDDCPLRSLSFDREIAIFKTNYFSFVEFVRHVTKKERFEEGLRIVSISSPAADYADKAHLTYAASKAAMNAAVRCMAKELAPKGICVNAIAPGWIKTDMSQNFIDSNGGGDSAIVKDIFNRQYLGIGTTEDIANAICFLLSHQAKFITGTIMNVDGGYCGSA